MHDMADLFWFVVGCAASLALVVVGIPFLFVARALLRPRPGPRRARRGLAYLLLAVDAATLALAAGAFLAPQFLNALPAAYDDYRLTHHLRAPRVVAGSLLPAGSVVRLLDGGDIDHGTVPVPTLVAGLPIVGDFVGGRWVLRGTLAAPTTLQGVPCGAGRFQHQENGNVSCLLGGPFAFAGHALAVGQPVGIVVSPEGTAFLEYGVLAQPERLFDVSWPAGSALGNTAERPERLAHAAPGSHATASICVPSGVAVPIPGAVLHGTLTFAMTDGYTYVSRGCALDTVAAPVPARDGYATVGGERLIRGRRPNDGTPWRWDDRSETEFE